MRKLSFKEMLLVFLDSFIGLENRHKQILYKNLLNQDSIYKFILNNKDYIASEIGESHYNTLLNSANERYFNYILSGLDKRGIEVVTIESSDYPEQLKQIDIPPLVLYAKGDISLLRRQSICVVGSRKSTELQKRVAEDFCEEFIKAGFVLVTGTAEGIDKVVLKQAEKNNAKIISVMANGFDHVYPAHHTDLLTSVIEHGGLVITELVAEVVSKSFLFPIRNRIMAGLSDASVIVSAGERSGAIHTANYAEEYGRHLFVVPSNVGITSGVGSNELIKRGGRLADTPNDVLVVFGKETSKEQQIKLNDMERKVINLLGYGEKHIEQISQKLGKPVFELATTLSQLELNGIVAKMGTNTYGLIKQLGGINAVNNS